MKTKKLVCYNCGGHGFITTIYESGQTSTICPVCGGIGTHEIQMTNADHIRSMSDEELAECLFQIGYDNGWSRKEYAIEWLQRPSGEEDKHETV